VKPEILCVLTALPHEFHAPTRPLRGILAEVGPTHIQVQFVDPRRRPAVPPAMIGGKIEIERIAEIHKPAVAPVRLLDLALGRRLFPNVEIDDAFPRFRTRTVSRQILGGDGSPRYPPEEQDPCGHCRPPFHRRSSPSSFRFEP